MDRQTAGQSKRWSSTSLRNIWDMILKIVFYSSPFGILNKIDLLFTFDLLYFIFRKPFSYLCIWRGHNQSKGTFVCHSKRKLNPGIQKYGKALMVQFRVRICTVKLCTSRFYKSFLNGLLIMNCTKNLKTKYQLNF